ncbi:MAG: hypothetical protein R2752_01655 [Vicinamibacterales bacterium]
MSKALPAITHLQYLVLDALEHDERAGRDLRALLAAFGVRSSAPAFYQMMARLEQARLVDGRYDQKVVDGQHVKERRYTLTKGGARALGETRHFYREREAAARAHGEASHA